MDISLDHLTVVNRSLHFRSGILAESREGHLHLLRVIDDLQQAGDALTLRPFDANLDLLYRSPFQLDEAAVRWELETHVPSTLQEISKRHWFASAVDQWMLIQSVGLQQARLGSPLFAMHGLCAMLPLHSLVFANNSSTILVTSAEGRMEIEQLSMSITEWSQQAEIAVSRPALVLIGEDVTQEAFSNLQRHNVNAKRFTWELITDRVECDPSVIEATRGLEHLYAEAVGAAWSALMIGASTYALL